MEKSMEVPQNLKLELPYNLAIPLLGIYLKEAITLTRKDTHLKVYCSMTYNSQDKETTWVSTDRWMDKQDGKYTLRQWNTIKPQK